MNKAPKIIIIMGITGSGKTTIGARLAQDLDCPFIDADDLHSADAREKMTGGTPLDDADRWPWLKRVSAAARKAAQDSGQCVVACSALKRTYRDALRADTGLPIQFVYLENSKDQAEKRLKQRPGHFMPASLVQSQLDALEPPASGENAITKDAAQDAEKLLADIVRALAR